MSDFESLIFWSKFRVLGTALKRFSQFVFFNFTSRSDRHFASDENNVLMGISKKWDRDPGVGTRTRDPRMGSWGENLA